MIEVNTSDWFEAQGWTPLPFQKRPGKPIEKVKVALLTPQREVEKLMPSGEELFRKP